MTNGIDNLRDVWNKLTPEEQIDLSKELNRVFQEEINREVLNELKRANAKDKLGNKLK